MHLCNRATEPSVMTSIRFSEEEVAEALSEFAIKRGYIFEDVALRDSRITRYDCNSGGTKQYELVLTAEGTSEPLIKEPS